MSTPILRAASSTLVPLGTVTAVPSIVSVTVVGAGAGAGGGVGVVVVSLMTPLLVALAADHVDHAEDRHDVGDHVVLDDRARRRQVDERGAAAVGLVRAPGAVGDDEEAEL